MRLLVVDTGLPGDAERLARLGAAFPEVEFVVPETRAAVAFEIADIDVMFGIPTREEFLAARELRWIQAYSSGVESIASIPELVRVDRAGNVYVADRHNDRIQVFGPDGELRSQLLDLALPQDIQFDADGNVFVAEMGHPPGAAPTDPTMAPALPRVSVFSPAGELLTRLEPTPDGRPPFFAIHTMAIDSRGNLYLGEATLSGKSIGGIAPPGSRSLWKLATVEAGGGE